MYKITSFWSAPRPQDVEAFEEYYENVHGPMAGRLPGLLKFESCRTAGTGDVRPAFYRVAELYFEDQAAMQAATTTPEWTEMYEDAGFIIKRFGVTLESGAGVPVEEQLTPGGPRPALVDQLRAR
jgi:uncharacterized protein (TIGR02118 family)